MYNQTEAILAQYDLEINEVMKGRGNYICNTNKGIKLLVPFCGSKEKGEFLKLYLQQLKEQGFFVEQILENKNAEAVTEDEVTGERFIIKDYITGTELNTSNYAQMEEAVCLLGMYHNASELVKIDIPQKLKENAGNVVDSRQRHYRELVKVKNYIRNRKKKNEFEQIYMKHYEPMLVTAEESIERLKKQELQSPECGICHGDYNQHNAVYKDGKWYIIHFENFTYSWQVVDLANFLRKMLEKNDWDIELGMQLIESYTKNQSLKSESLHQLYGLLLFPEKFWKVTNHYMNSRKAWISGRDIDKLKKVIEQETKRLKFMENLFSILE